MHPQSFFTTHASKPDALVHIFRIQIFHVENGWRQQQQQLDDLQRELEDLRLENRIFKSYYERHASEITAEVDDDKRKTNRQRRRQIPTVLTIEQKVEIGAHEQEVAQKDVSLQHYIGRSVRTRATSADVLCEGKAHSGVSPFQRGRYTCVSQPTYLCTWPSEVPPASVHLDAQNVPRPPTLTFLTQSWKTRSGTPRS